MLYAIIASDVANSLEKRLAARPAHIERLQQLKAEGRVVQGDAENPNVTLVMDSETLKGIVSGETDGMQAFMGGKLRVEGDMMLSMKLSELFPA